MIAALGPEERWFQSILGRPSANLTVLAGNDFANRTVAVFETAEEAKEAVDAHNARLNASGPASAPTLPDLGSNNPCQENAVNEQHRTTAPAVAPDIEADRAELRELWAEMLPDERAAIHAYALALLHDGEVDPVAVMAPFIGQEKAEAVQKAVQNRAMGRAA